MLENTAIFNFLLHDFTDNELVERRRQQTHEFMKLVVKKSREGWAVHELVEIVGILLSHWQSVRGWNEVVVFFEELAFLEISQINRVNYHPKENCVEERSRIQIDAPKQSLNCSAGKSLSMRYQQNIGVYYSHPVLKLRSIFLTKIFGSPVYKILNEREPLTF